MSEAAEPAVAAPTPLKLLVYVVESPSSNDAYDNRAEGAALLLAGQLDGIHVQLRYAIDRPHFEKALTHGFADALGSEQYDLIFLHLSAHGDRKGVTLSDETFVSWQELHEMLIPLNQALGHRLILSLSACEGLNAIWAGLTLDKDSLPYIALIGSSHSPTWSETAIGYATFYHHLATGNHNFNQAVRAMRIASGHAFEWKSIEIEKKRMAETLEQIQAGLQARVPEHRVVRDEGQSGKR